MFANYREMVNAAISDVLYKAKTSSKGIKQALNGPHSVGPFQTAGTSFIGLQMSSELCRFMN